MVKRKPKRKGLPDYPVPMPNVCTGCEKHRACASSGDYICPRWSAVFKFYWDHTVSQIKKITGMEE